MTEIPEKDKRAAILAGTLDLIAEQGFHGTPMSQVAKHSGVSIGIIYHYFENKDTLIHELYRDIKKKFSEALIAGQAHKAEWPENVQLLWMNAYQFYVAHPKETFFLEQYENSPYQQAWAETEMDANFAALFDMIQQNIDAGHVQTMPHEVLYELTLGVALGLAKRQIAGHVTLDQATLARVAAACCRAVAST